MTIDQMTIDDLKAFDRDDLIIYLENREYHDCESEPTDELLMLAIMDLISEHRGGP